jgi:hypothetical protein
MMSALGMNSSDETTLDEGSELIVAAEMELISLPEGTYS